ncbi:MAG: P-loop NTPase [Magnetococcus sp. DMHC-8]
MTTFDHILPMVTETLGAHSEMIARLDWLLINRDLNGRVRFIVPDSIKNSAQDAQIQGIYQDLARRMAPHAYPVAAGILYEAVREQACQGAAFFVLAGFDNVWVVDRLASASRWEAIAEVAPGVPRIVFFSIKGGVGRSTALAATAWALAREGERVLVLDLDLESPGLSSALLPPERQPKYGIADWLVEDLVDNGEALIDGLIATTGLPTAGQIYLVPAHGREPGEYVSKLGRVWMPKTDGQALETWSSRLNRLVNRLEQELSPNTILIDARAGIDEVAAACVTGLGAHTVLMFAIQGRQTWTGYHALFSYWQQLGVIEKIRRRLQLVAGLVPDDERRLEYLATMRSDAYQLFEDTYDAVAPGAIGDWSFAEDDYYAPHAPVPVLWNRGWYGLLSLQHRMAQVDENEVRAVYGGLLDYLRPPY